MPKLDKDAIPEDLCSFDQPSRVRNAKSTALHFYNYDKKFRNVLKQPEVHLANFMKYQAILCPDITISKEMPVWVRIRNTQLSRCVGAYYASRQLQVIPSLRWAELSDLDFVVEGVPEASVIAMGALGTYRDLEKREVFEKGVLEILERLKPIAVIVYGNISPELEKKVLSKTTLVKFVSPMAQRKQSPEVDKESDLFVA
jgi:Domain of unknown function (DUF4417)